MKPPPPRRRSKLQWTKVADGNRPDENEPPVGTPRTQRHRNALPATPKHRVQVASKPITPRTPRTIAMTTPKSSTATVYSAARQLFVRSAAPGRLVGRDQERTELSQFIQNAVDSSRGGCMYISGPPGTGKSALLDEVCRDLAVVAESSKVKVANVNCASMKSARDIYGRLVAELCDDDAQLFRKSEIERLRGLFLPKRGSASLYLVALDEIDHLLVSDPEILYTFFEWALEPKARLILIGIANALDLTDRFLPRLKTKNLKPQLLPFLPYTASQLSQVITSRLRSLVAANDSDAPDGYVPILHPAAVQLCARKVASQSGDLRKACDLVGRTIDVVERETLQKAGNDPASPSKTPLVENTNLATPLSPPNTPSSIVAQYTASTAPRATVAHVARVTSAALSNGTTERLQGLNLQQKAALCALVSFRRNKRTEQNTPRTPIKSPSSGSGSVVPTVKQLFGTYSSLCRRDRILHPLTMTEFRDVIGSLEAMGLVGEAQTSSGRGRAGTSSAYTTPTKTGRGGAGSRTPSKKSAGDTELVCYVSEKEVEGQISGPGEGVLKALLREEF